MDIVGLILAGLGGLGAVVSGIWLLVCAFKKSIVWGLVTFFIPFASIAYIAMDWQKAQKPFFVYLISLAFIGVGFAVSPSIREGASASRTGTSAYPATSGSHSSSSSSSSSP